MDLHAIINSDSTGVPKNTAAAPPPSPLQLSGYGQDYLHSGRQRDEISPGSYPAHGDYRVRPPPLQAPLSSPAGSSSYGSAQSPYQRTSAMTLSGGPHSQTCQPLTQSLQTYLPASRDSYAPHSASSGHSQSAAHLSSPYTPQTMSAGTPQSYFPQQRSHSIHSVPTPSSTRSYSITPRESGGSAQPSLQSQPHPQTYSPHQPRSQPGTPLGPPTASYPRPSPHSGRPPSSGRDPQPNQLSSPWSAQEPLSRDQRDAASPAAQASVSRHSSGPVDGRRGQYSVEREKERSASVSPKTIVPKRPGSGDNSDFRDQTARPCRKDMDDVGWRGENVAANLTGNTHDAGGTTLSRYPPTTPQAPQPRNLSRPSTISPPSQRPLANDKPCSGMPSQASPLRESDRTSLALELTSSAPKRKRRRYEEPPIYAQKASRASGDSPMIPSGRPPCSKPIGLRQETKGMNAVSRNMSLPPRPPHPVKEEINGQESINGNAVQDSLPDRHETSLGPWEPSITGKIPHEEVTKVICDFLFQQVVVRKDIGAGPAGGTAMGQGAILEIEAKLGQIVDRNRGERLRLPVLTECVISKDDPSIRTAFESSMTLAQHRALNNFLNDSVKASIAQQGTHRIPLTYAHKKERDTFYEISPSALPPIVQHHLHPRHKPKVRITTDQRTGSVLARIVKCRIADLDVYSPRTCLDWRVSVNLEMNYDGNVTDLAPLGDSGPAGRRGSERNKDRMSYRHLAYQIDLTQVATEGSSNPQFDFEHELEIELSAAEVRRQGDLALLGDPKNQYEELVKGFVDNIRVLARAVPGQ